MAQPTAYSPATAFVGYESQQSWFPGSRFDTEFRALRTTTNDIRRNLALIQRDDGHLKNGVVTYESLSATVKALLGLTLTEQDLRDLLAEALAGSRFHVSDYGAVAGEDCTDAFEAAVAAATAAGAGTVEIGYGAYYLSRPILIEAGGIYIRGQGPDATTIRRTHNSGATFKFSNGTTTPIGGVGISDMSFIADLTMTYGSSPFHLDFDNVFRAKVDNITMHSGCGGIRFAAVVNGWIDRFFPGFADTDGATNRAGIRVEASSIHGLGTPWGGNIFISNTDIWGGYISGSSVVSSLDFGIDVTAVDGLWLSNVHTFNNASADYRLSRTSATNTLANIYAVNTMADHNNGYGLLIDGAYLVANVIWQGRFSSLDYGADLYHGIGISGPLHDAFFAVAVEGYKASGIYVGNAEATDITFQLGNIKNCDSSNNARTNAGGGVWLQECNRVSVVGGVIGGEGKQDWGVRIGSAANGVSVSGLTIADCQGPAIRVDSGATRFSISGVLTRGCSSAIAIASGATDFVLNGIGAFGNSGASTDNSGAVTKKIFGVSDLTDYTSTLNIVDTTNATTTTTGALLVAGGIGVAKNVFADTIIGGGAGGVQSRGTLAAFTLYDRATNSPAIVHYAPALGDYRVFDFASGQDILTIGTGNFTVKNTTNSAYIGLNSTATGGRRWNLIAKATTVVSPGADVAEDTTTVPAGSFIIHDSVSDVARVVVQSNGNVGIGTNGSADRLSNHNTSFTDQTGTGLTGVGVSWSAGATGYLWAVQNSSAGATANGLLAKVSGTAATNRIFTAMSGATDRFTVLGDGNTIAKGNLISRADISGVASGQVYATGLANTSQMTYVGYDTTNNRGVVQAQLVGTGFKPLLLNPNGGNVVIGAVGNGTEILDVTGNIKASGALTVGTAIAATSGGTGFASYAVGDILYASTTTALSKLADVATGNALISGGVGVAPSWGKVGLTTHISGTLAEGNGGTNQTTYATGDILYASASNTLSKLAGVATGNALISGGVTTAPSWGKVNLASGGHVTGLLPFANIADGSSLSVFGRSTNSAGVQASIAGTANQVLCVNAAGTALAFGTATIAGGGTGATSFGASRIPYMNAGNTALTSVSTFVFDGTNLGIGGTPVGLLSVNTASATGNTSIWDATYAVFGPGAASSSGKAIGIGYNTVSDYGEIRSIQPGTAWKDLYIRGLSVRLFYQDGGGTTTEGLRITASTGAVTAFSPTGGIGYGTGAGGTVTQATNKSTGVTLNKVVGQITMNNASLNAATSVSFVLTNSAIAAGDLVHVNIVSGATALAYVVTVEAVAAGSATIQIRNNSAGALGEAVVLGFFVFKGVTS